MPPQTKRLKEICDKCYEKHRNEDKKTNIRKKYHRNKENM